MKSNKQGSRWTQLRFALAFNLSSLSLNSCSSCFWLSSLESHKIVVLSSIYELLKNSKLFNDKSDTDIYIIPIGTEIECLKLANEYRNKGYNVEIEMKKRKLKKSLEYANKEKIQYVIVLGEDEIKNRSFILKDMFSGDEKLIKEDKLKLTDWKYIYIW